MISILRGYSVSNRGTLIVLTNNKSSNQCFSQNKFIRKEIETFLIIVMQE